MRERALMSGLVYVVFHFQALWRSFVEEQNAHGKQSEKQEEDNAEHFVGGAS